MTAAANLPVALAPNLQPRRAVVIILNRCRTGAEQTEECLWRASEIEGVGRDAFDLAVDELLDTGLIRSTVIDARSTGHGYLPALVAA